MYTMGFGVHWPLFSNPINHDSCHENRPSNLSSSERFFVIEIVPADWWSTEIWFISMLTLEIEILLQIIIFFPNLVKHKIYLIVLLWSTTETVTFVYLHFTSADHQLPEWPSVLRNRKFGQTDYPSALFPQTADNHLTTQNQYIIA